MGEPKLRYATTMHVYANGGATGHTLSIAARNFLLLPAGLSEKVGVCHHQKKPPPTNKVRKP